MTTTTLDRPLYVIAREIARDWPRPFFGAVPYLRAMASLDRVSDPYGLAPGREIVLYFLSNAAGWKGETARRIKAELKAMLKNAKPNPQSLASSNGDN